jgi:transcriptional regulator with GAF, ATPase, and Fis domain
MNTQNLGSPTRPQTQAFLTLLGTHTRQTLELGEYLSLGRFALSDLVLEDAFVSTRHARVEKRDGQYYIRDLGSRNGTFVNGTKVLEAQLKDRDRVQLGNCQFLFSFVRDIRSQQLVTKSKNRQWNQQLEKLPRMAESDLPVLIYGPSGSGKELLARAIHHHSHRQRGPFLSVNCSALSENLVESELFGHLAGSFTGASANRKGAFETARGGTLFLDEVGDLPLSLQPKLLRALENREIRPVGGDRTILTDVRIVSATHQNLWDKVSHGKFREDLLYRLMILQIIPPALRDRLEDFDGLLYEFAKSYKVSFAYTAIEKLKTYDWPGNIRELKNTVARASALLNGGSVEEEHLQNLLQNATHPFPLNCSPKNGPVIKELERRLICESLVASGGNQRKAAEALGLPKSTLHDRIKRYEINLKKLLSDPV